MAKVLEDPETEELLRNASGGGPAVDVLLERHRKRLRRMVTVRLDRRLAPLVAPSDVVQEALADASRKLNDFLRDRPLPFYPWLRRLALGPDGAGSISFREERGQSSDRRVYVVFTCCPSRAQTRIRAGRILR